MDVDPQPISNYVKPMIFSLAQYVKSPTETNFTKANLDLEEFIDVIGSSNFEKAFGNENLLTEFLNQICNVLANPKTDPTLCSQIFKLLRYMVPDFKAAPVKFQSLTSPLCKYVLHSAKSENYFGHSKDLLLESLKLLEKLSYGHKNVFNFCNVDGLVMFCLKMIELGEEVLSVPSLGVLSNMVSSSFAIQAQVKGTMKDSNMRNLIKIFTSDSGANKISVLSIITHMSWDDPLIQKFFNVKNVTQSFKLVLARVTNFDNFISQHRAADLCIEFLKHDKIQQQFAVMETKLDKSFYSTSLISATENEENMECIAKVLEVVYAISQLNQLRGWFSSQTRNNSHILQIIINFVTTDRNSQVSWLAICILCEICEESLSTDVDAGDSLWLNSTLDVLAGELSISLLTDSNLIFTFQKVLKILSFFKTLCNESDLQNIIVDKINSLLPRVIDYQLHHNLIGLATSKLSDWSEIGVGVMISALRLLLLLKNYSIDLSTKLHSTLQDSQITPFLASALTSSKQTRVLNAIELLKETSHLPDFADILLADRITSINKSNPNSNISCLSIASDEDLTNRNNGVDLSLRSSASSVHPTTSEMKSKDDIVALIAQINEDDCPPPTDSESSSKTSELAEMYENKLSMFVVKEKQLQELLDAKTSALARADQLNSLCRNQSASSEVDLRKLREMLRKTEDQSQKLQQKCTASQHYIDCLKNDLQSAFNENESLRKIADQYDKLQTSYQEKIHKVQVLERNLDSAREEHEELKELKNLIQKHNDKMTEQQAELKTKLEKSESERLDLTKRCQDLEASIQNLTNVVENQEMLNNKLEEGRIEDEHKIGELREKIQSHVEDLRQLNSKLSSSDASRQQAEHKVKELTIESRKLHSKNENLKTKLKQTDENMKALNEKHQQTIHDLQNSSKQLTTELKTKEGQLKDQLKKIEQQDTQLTRLKKKFEKSAKTLAMITELSNNMQSSQ